MMPTLAVPVRATCKCGYVLETEAPKGRGTWRGPCPACQEQPAARRVLTTDRNEEPAGDEPPANRKRKTPAKRPVKKVSTYRDAEPSFDEPPATEPDVSGGGAGARGDAAGIQEPAEPAPPG